MDRNMINEEVLLINEQKNHKKQSKLKVVNGINESGEIESRSPTSKNNPSFMILDRHGDVLDNFFKNLVRQHKDPTEFEFFKLPRKAISKTAKVLEQMLQDPSNPIHKEEIEKYRVNPNGLLKDQTANKQTTSEEKQIKPKIRQQSIDKKTVSNDNSDVQGAAIEESQQSSIVDNQHPNNDSVKNVHSERQNRYKNCKINPDRVDWRTIEQLGISRDSLEKDNTLEGLLNGQKTTKLIPLKIKVGSTTIETEAKLQLQENSDGKVEVVTYPYRRTPNLGKPFYGHNFTEEQKSNLLKNGHAGEPILIERKDGQKIPILVSLDRLTNDIVAVRQSKVDIPKSIKGAELTPKQHQDLTDGKPVYVTGMTSKYGKPFNATLQFNSEKRGVVFQFDKRHTLKTTQSNISETDSSQSNRLKPIYIPKRLLGAELTKEQQDKLQKRDTIYVENMRDRKGKKFNAYIRVNDSKEKLDFFRWNPNIAKSQSKEIVPDSRSKTQVEINSNGKSNEATKHIKEPLHTGQDHYTKQNNSKKSQKRMSL